METARAILRHAITVFPGKKSLYRQLAHLERQHGTPEAVAEVLERGVKYCPQVCHSLYHMLECGTQALSECLSRGWDAIWFSPLVANVWIVY